MRGSELRLAFEKNLKNTQSEVFREQDEIQFEHIGHFLYSFTTYLRKYWRIRGKGSEVKGLEGQNKECRVWGGKGRGRPSWLCYRFGRACHVYVMVDRTASSRCCG